MFDDDAGARDGITVRLDVARSERRRIASSRIAPTATNNSTAFASAANRGAAQAIGEARMQPPLGELGAAPGDQQPEHVGRLRPASASRAIEW